MLTLTLTLAVASTLTPTVNANRNRNPDPDDLSPRLSLIQSLSVDASVHVPECVCVKMKQ